jgi:hypothetical protein
VIEIHCQKADKTNFMQYNKSPIESKEKKEKFKKYSHKISEELKKVDIIGHYGYDYISENGTTINDFSDLIKKLSSCGNNSKYQIESKIDGDGLINEKYKLVETSSCHCYSICPACASTKRSKIISSIKPYVNTASIMNLNLYMVTITIDGSSDISGDYTRLRDSWTNFVKMGQMRENKTSHGEASKFLGTVLSIEIIPEQKDTTKYHVHGHVLVLAKEKLQFTIYDQKEKAKLSKIYGNKIPKHLLDTIALKTIDSDGLNKKNQKMAVSKISHEWYKSSGAINIHVAPIKERVIKGKVKSVESQLYEVIKYETKPWELDGIKLFDVFAATRGKKKITKSGIFTNNKRYSKIWIDLLESHGLKSYFETLLKGTIEPEVTEDTEDILQVIHSSLEFDYNSENERYQTTYSKKTFDHLQTTEYKDYLKDKAKIICIYKANLKNHIIDLIENRNKSKVDPEFIFDKTKWINQKKNLQNNMRDSIKKITLEIKSFIKQFYYLPVAA